MSECELGSVELTDRHFEFVRFLDRRDRVCTLQQSSAVGDYEDAIERPGTSFVWLGIEHENSPRMHLNRIDVAALVETLGRWLETGSFVYDTKEE